MTMADDQSPTLRRSISHHLSRRLTDAWWHIWRTCKLFSPTLWRNVARSPPHRVLPLSKASVLYMWQAVWTLLLPPLLIHGVDMALIKLGGRVENNHAPSRSSSGFLAKIASSPRQLRLEVARAAPTITAISPTTIARVSAAMAYMAVNCYTVWKASTPIRVTGNDIVSMYGRRSTTLNSSFFADLCAKGRVVPGFYYDVYIPPQSDAEQATTVKTTTNKNPTAILFLPGAGVEHRAYANPAHLFSERGYLVVVACGEPLRHISPEMGYDAAYFRRTCIDPVGSQYAIKEWYLVGHSMGAFCATRIAEDLSVPALVMWGAAPFVPSLGDLSHNKTIRVGVVQGSNDVIVKWVLENFQPPTGPDLTQTFWKRLPSTSREWVIRHGTHCGFADYRSDSFPEENMLLSRQAQQERAVELTHQFLSQTESTPATS